ncbi:MAG: copper chaperone [Clostridia bacterium]|nr:copper chaperone [Clostridia bacterium]
MKNVEKVTLKVEGMSCNHCKNSVEMALLGVDGVEAAVVDLARGEARVTYDPGRTTVAALREAVQAAGYAVR